MKHFYVLFLVFFTTLLYASPGDSANRMGHSNKLVAGRPFEPQKVNINIRIDHISDISFHDQDYKIDFWMWIECRDTNIHFEKELQVPLAKKVEIQVVHKYWDKEKKMKNILLRVNCTMYTDWDVNDYPFDCQWLCIKIINPAYDKDSLLFMQAPEAQKDKPGYVHTEKGWQSMPENQTISFTTDTLSNTFNNTASKVYSCIRMGLVLKRTMPVPLFFKLFLGMYVSFLVAFMAFYIPVEHPEARFGVPVGGLFAAIGNKYVIESLLPETPVWTNVDWLHSITISGILVVVIFSVISLYIYERHKRHEHVRFRKFCLWIDKRGALLLFVMYTLINLVFFMHGVIEARIDAYIQ